MKTILAVLLTLGAALPAAAQTVEIQEWRVPWAQTRPRDAFVGRDGTVWFVGQAGNYAATLDPRTGQFRRYDLPGAGPHNIIVDEEGAVWYTGNAAGHIGKLDPATGTVTRYEMPEAAANDPHTLVSDGRGSLWFTVQGGNFVGRLEKASGRVRLIPVPTPRARPYGIALDSRGRVWFNEFGVNKTGMIDPATMTVREYALPDAAARGRRIALTRDDAVWYVDYARGYLARLDPASGAVKEWALPSGGRSQPYSLAVDDRDRLWMVETGVQPNRLVGFDPATERFFGATPIASGGGTVRHMVFDRASRELWFGTDAGTIARARVP